MVIVIRAASGALQLGDVVERFADEVFRCVGSDNMPTGSARRAITRPLQRKQIARDRDTMMRARAAVRGDAMGPAARAVLLAGDDDRAMFAGDHTYVGGAG